MEVQRFIGLRIRENPKDARFLEKFTDVVGLYVDPPAHAVVLSMDEMSRIQALDRTQPGLPLKKGRAGTVTHDDRRHGATTCEPISLVVTKLARSLRRSLTSWIRPQTLR